MCQSRVYLALVLVPFALALWACSSAPQFAAKEEPWRAEEERACLASGTVRENNFIAARTSLGGPSVCGAIRPFAVTAAMHGWVQLKPHALLRCQMVPAIDRWVERVVVPAARHHFGAAVVELRVAASYSCRPMNHIDGARLSEHGHANALDVAGFVLADGRTIAVKSGWRGPVAERSFLHDVHRGACGVFTTVLGPDYDANHHDHFHLDLARHGRDGDGHICK
jgi:hypothetical protein